MAFRIKGKYAGFIKGALVAVVAFYLAPKTATLPVLSTLPPIVHVLLIGALVNQLVLKS